MLREPSYSVTLLVHPECSHRSQKENPSLGDDAVEAWPCRTLSATYDHQLPVRNLLTEAFQGEIPKTLLDEGRDSRKFGFVQTSYKPAGNTVAQFSKRR